MKRNGRRLCSVLLLVSMAAGLISPGTASGAELLKKSVLNHALTDFEPGGEADAATGSNMKPVQISDLISKQDLLTKKKPAKATDSILNAISLEKDKDPEDDDDESPEDDDDESPEDDDDEFEDETDDEQVATASSLLADNIEDDLGDVEDVYQLKDIIGSHGKAMYTTLLDKDGKVLSTNDPKVKEPEKPDEVKAGDAINVKFRMEEIVPNNGDDGVQEDRVYVMSLPDELVPAAESTDGEQLVNPSEPVKFFGDKDGIQAYGGIYTVNDEYQLRMIFENVEEWIDISGYFQYGANVSSSVEPGKTYELKYVPGGTVKFTVAKDSPSVQYDNYKLSLSGSTGGATTYYWQVNIDKVEDKDTTKTDGESGAATEGTDKTDTGKSETGKSDTEEDSAVFPYRELTIDTDDAMGVWVNEEDQGIFNAYGDKTGPGCMLGITYQTKDSDGKNMSKSVKADSDSIIKDENGKTVIRFIADDIQADVEFRKSDAVEDTIVRNSDGKYSYITNKIHVHISDGNGGNAKNIQSLALYVPTLTYDDYCRTGSVSYDGKAVLSANASDDDDSTSSGESQDDSEDEEDDDDEDAENEDIETVADVEDVTAKGSVDVYYNNLTSPTYYNSAQDSPMDSYEYLPESIHTGFNTGNTYYKGNYYWMEYDPAVENNSGANYYLSNWSFLPGHGLWSESGDKDYATFDKSGSGLYGMTGTSDFEYLRKVSVAQIQGDRNLVADILTPENSSDEKPQLDAKLQYQLKKVFSQSSGDGYVLIYRSKTPHKYGEYSYLIIDPQTAKTAEENNNKGWKEYIEGTSKYSSRGYSAKAASFKIHVFNAPCTMLQLQMTEKIGSVITDDNDYQYGNQPTLKNGIKAGIKEENGDDDQKYNITWNCQFNKYKSSYMEGVWADEDTVFWEMTFDTGNWPSSSTGNGSIYVNAGRNMRIQGGSSKIVKIEGTELDSKNLYVKNPNTGAWESVNISGPYSGSWYNQATSMDMTENTTLSSNSGDHTYQFRYYGSNWSDYRDSNNDVRIGFFTRVTQMPENSENQELSCKAEVVVQNGDVSKRYGYSLDQFPSIGQGTNIQYPFKISATGITPLPSLEKSGSVSYSNSSDSKMDAVWEIKINELKEAKGAYNGPLLSGTGYYLQDGYSGLLSVTDDMKDSEATDISGTKVSTVNPGQYTYIKRMLWNGDTAASISIGESRGGGSCYPVPYKITDKQGYTNVMGSSNSNWQKYVNGNWVSAFDANHAWDPYSPGIYKCVLNRYRVHSNEPLEVYIYYAGNMYDTVAEKLGSELSSLTRDASDEAYSHSLVVEYRGLKWVTSISPLVYTTEFDQNAFRNAAGKAAGASETQIANTYYGITLNNSAGFGYWSAKGKTPVSASVKNKISALLSIDKKADPVVKGCTGGFSGNYTLKVVNGISASEYVGIEDFLTGFTNVKAEKIASGNVEYVNGTNYNVETDSQDEKSITAVKALARHMSVSNLVITAKDTKDENAAEKTVYENGNFASGWTNSSLSLLSDTGYSSDRAGSLFMLKLKNNMGIIPAEMEFTISYTLTLDMDATDAELDNKSFRQSDYYTGNGLKVFNNAEASRTYTSLQTNSIMTANDSNSANTNSANSNDSQDENANVLKVDCGGSVDSTYLTRELLYKTNEDTDTVDANTTNWLSCAYTGTMGKGESANKIVFNDALSYETQKLLVQNPETGEMVSYAGFSEPMKSNIANVFEHIVEKNSTYKNIKLYYTNTKPSASSDLKADELIWTVPQQTFGGTEIKNGKLYYPDGVSHNYYSNLRMDLTLGSTPSSGTESWSGNSSKYPNIRLKLTTTPATLSIASTDPWKLSHGHAGFTVEAEGLERQKYLVATYQVETDWDKVYKEAAEIFGSVSYSGAIKNLLDDGLDENASAKGNVISITDFNLTKNAVSTTPAAGEGQWQLVATTGSQANDELTIEDHFEIQIPEDSILSDEEKEVIKKAATAATSIDPASVTISQGYSSIYNQQTPATGWSDNLTVELLDNGKKLKIVIKNLEDDKVLDKNQTYTVKYNTKFDSATFIKNGGYNYKNDGTDNKKVEYTLANTATMKYGSMSKSAVKEKTFYPETPVGAEKTPGKSDGNIQPWTAAADTKAADRKDFRLSDQVTVKNADDDKKNAYNDALYLSSWSVKVLTYDDANGTNITDTKEYTIDTLPQGVTLTDQNGDPLKLGKTGVRGFTLTFNELAAKHKVLVSYVTALDRDKFLEAGGKDGDIVSLSNNFNVSAVDGNSKGVLSTGKVTTKTPFEKKGDAKTAGTTADGNQILTWSVDVNLSELYTLEELKDLNKVTITDNMNSALSLISTSVEVKDTAGKDITPAPTWQLKGNQLTVDIEDPSAHPNFTLTFRTECQASMDNLTNDVELSVDGEKKDTTKSNELKDLVALGQYGQIMAMKSPDVTIDAYKYVDHEICKEAGKYRFEITEVNLDGEPLTGKDAYSEIVSNDENGKIQFSKIHYSNIRADLAVHYYQIREVADSVDDVILDDRLKSRRTEITIWRP